MRWPSAAAPAASATTGIVQTVAGTGVIGFSGDGGPANVAQLGVPVSVSAAPDGGYLIVDQGNNTIRRVLPNGTIARVAGDGTTGAGGDGGPATAAQLNAPNAAVMTAVGEILIADSNNNRVRKVATDGTITPIAGPGTPPTIGDGGPANQAWLAFPAAVALTPDGGYVIADNDNHRVRKVASLSPTATITTIVGDGTPGVIGDGGPATAARLNGPAGVAVAPDGSIVIADTDNSRVRRATEGGNIVLVAGTTVGFSGDGGAGTAARLHNPTHVAVANNGTVLVADRSNHRIRQVSPGGTITTLAGIGTDPGAFSGDGGLATAAELNSPFGVAVRTDGDTLIADTLNRRIRLVDTAGGDGPPPPAPPPPPPPPPPAPRVISNPTLTAVSRTASTMTLGCPNTKLEGLAPNTPLTTTWFKVSQPVARLRVAPLRRVTLGNGLTSVVTQVKVGTTYTVRPTVEAGTRVVCAVTAKSITGKLVGATSPIGLLTPARPILLRTDPYGSFRIRGIDVYQTTQPNAGARMYGFPSAAFAVSCGGGTPTSHAGSGCPAGASPQRVIYDGVEFDQRKRITAVVYYNMTNAVTTFSGQDLLVTLRARLGGREQPTVLTQRVRNPNVSASPFVTAAERNDPAFGVRFTVPPSWLASAAITGQQLDLDARIALPPEAGGGTMGECDLIARLVAAAANCTSTDNRFVLFGLPGNRDLPELRIRPVPLLTTGQTAAGFANNPTQLMQQVIDQYPAGELLDVEPFGAAVDISGVTTRTSTANCGAVPKDETTDARDRRVRDCRQTFVDQQLDAWWRRDAPTARVTPCCSPSTTTTTAPAPRSRGGSVAAHRWRRPGQCRRSRSTTIAPTPPCTSSGTCSASRTRTGTSAGFSAPPGAAGGATDREVSRGRRRAVAGSRACRSTTTTVRSASTAREATSSTT